MHALVWPLTFVGAIALIALGVRSFVRISRRARAAGELEAGPADSLGHSGSVYGYAFTHWSLDTTVMLVGFVGGLVWAIAVPALLAR